MRIARFIIAAAASSAAIAQPAPPRPANPPIAVAGQKPAPVTEKPVCQYMNTGTLIPKKICMSASEWARLGMDTEGAKNSMNDFQRTRCRMGSAC